MFNKNATLFGKVVTSCRKRRTKGRRSGGSEQRQGAEMQKQWTPWRKRNGAEVKQYAYGVLPRNYHECERVLARFTSGIITYFR